MLNPPTSKSQYRSLYAGPSNASYSLSKASRVCASILKRFHALFLTLCTLIECLVLAMPPQSLKIDHLPGDASAILRERYFAGTFSVVTQWVLGGEESRGQTDTYKQRVLMHGHQGWNVRHGLCHIYMIYVYIWVVYSFCLFCCLFIIVTTQFVALYKPCKPKPKPSTYDPPHNHPLAEI